MLHLHLTSIVHIVVLFIIALILYKKDPLNKGAKITHMVLRILYLVAIASGLYVYVTNMEGISNSDGHMTYGLKVLFGILTIVFSEMGLVAVKKRGNILLAVLAGVCAIVTIIFGAILPLGIL